MDSAHVIIIGAGFAGINAAKKLGNINGVRVTIIDKKIIIFFNRYYIKLLWQDLVLQKLHPP